MAVQKTQNGPATLIKRNYKKTFSFVISLKFFLTVLAVVFFKDSLQGQNVHCTA